MITPAISQEFDEFERRYNPLPDEGGEIFRQSMPEGVDPHYIWTLSRADGDEFVDRGIHGVDRMAYVVCQHPWEEDDPIMWYHWDKGAETRYLEKWYAHSEHPVQMRGEPLEAWCRKCNVKVFGVEDIAEINERAGEEYDYEAEIAAERFAPHKGHKLALATFSSTEEGVYCVHDIAIACERCDEVLLDTAVIGAMEG